MKIFCSTLGSLILTFSVLTSCTKMSARFGIDPKPERMAAAAVADSFAFSQLATAADETVDHAHVVIAKAALEKEFLFSSNILSQQPTPMFQSLQSRVVYFTLKNNHVYMLESANGLAAGKNNSTQFLALAEFEIINQTAENITIDFGAGMKSIITLGDMYSSDDPTVNAGLSATKVNFSYLQSVQYENNQIFIEQIAQLSKDDKIVPAVIRYYLLPYLPDPTFVPTRSPGFDQVGYFEANPLLDFHGNNLIYAMKWDIRKPIVFALSANTPAEYKDTVRNGVLYWNKILGDNKIQVIELTDESITAPNPFYNIIQWVDWDSAGYAYADAHVDPRSGQVTHAQVFFPSAFIQATAEKRVRTLEGSDDKNNKLRLGLAGFKSAELCRRNIITPFSESLAVSGETISNEATMKAVKDYVFEVIAHEVGHVLGLRHNFAGNLAANYDMSERRDLALSYYRNMKVPAGIVASSSVMEYSRFEESSWNGDMLQHGAPALAHDQVTMDFLYNGIAIPKNAPLFCTDSHIAKYADCSMSDASRSEMSYAVGNYNYSLQSLPVKVLNQYIAEAKVPDAAGMLLKNVEAVALKPETYAHTISLDRYKLMSLFKDEVRLIQVRGALYPLWPSNEVTALAIEKDFVASEINRLGGLDKVLNLKEATIDAEWTTKFAELLNDPAFNQGAVAGTHYEFSEEEKKEMLSQFSSFAVALKFGLIKHNLKALTAENVSFEDSYGQAKLETTKGWFDHPITNDLAVAIKKVSDFYLFSKNSARGNFQIYFQNGASNQVELPVFTYSSEVRTVAAGVWEAPHLALDWGYNEKIQSADQMKSEISILLDADKIDYNKTNKFVLKWFLINQELVKKFN